MRREWLLSFGAVVLAFLGTQHHNLMMLFLALGLGDAGMSAMTEFPLVRTVMLALSLVMVAAIGYQISRPNRPTVMRVTGALSILFTLGLAGWSVLRVGLSTPVMEKPFQRDLGHLGWDQVYARQELRAELVNDWMEALRLKSGDRVLEIGAGPGYVSFALADRVGPAGIVYALDRSADALAHLEGLQKERGVWHIQRVVADAAVLEPIGVQADSALITMVLHHADDPAGILYNVVRFLVPGAPVVIGEFHPEGPCSHGRRASTGWRRRRFNSGVSRPVCWWSAIGGGRRNITWWSRSMAPDPRTRPRLQLTI